MGILNFLKRRPPHDDQRLHGRWVLMRSDDPTADVGEGVKMEFTADGRLTYTIKQKDRRQIMNLVYKVRGAEIVSNQPSAPAENRTGYTFDDQGLLVDCHTSE
jgi:hypothetical protein